MTEVHDVLGNPVRVGDWIAWAATGYGKGVSWCAGKVVDFTPKGGVRCFPHMSHVRRLPDGTRQAHLREAQYGPYPVGAGSMRRVVRIEPLDIAEDQ